jgi:hypothetical protein
MEDFKDLLRELAPAAAAGLIGLIVFAAVAAPFIWFQARQEASAFNRFTTGPKATAWDAVWVELRVEAGQ